jgi:hypothetical protein
MMISYQSVTDMVSAYRAALLVTRVRKYFSAQELFYLFAV